MFQREEEEREGRRRSMFTRWKKADIDITKGKEVEGEEEGGEY